MIMPRGDAYYPAPPYIIKIINRGIECPFLREEILLNVSAIPWQSTISFSDFVTAEAVLCIIIAQVCHLLTDGG